MLTRRDLTRLLVRIFGLIILASAVVGLPLSINRFVVYLSVLDGARAVYSWQDVVLVGSSYLGQLVIYAAVGLCFLWWSGRIIDRASLAPERGENEAVVESTDLRNIEISVVAVLGLYFVADGLAELCRVSFRFAPTLWDRWLAVIVLACGPPLFRRSIGKTNNRHFASAWSRGDRSRAAWRSRLGPKDAHMARLSLSLDCRYFAVGMITNG